MADFKAKYLLMNVEVILKHFTFHDTQFITSIWLRHVTSLCHHHHHHHHLFCYRDVGVLCSIRITALQPRSFLRTAKKACIVVWRAVRVSESDQRSQGATVLWWISIFKAGARGGGGSGGFWASPLDFVHLRHHRRQGPSSCERACRLHVPLSVSTSIFLSLSPHPVNIL